MIHTVTLKKKSTCLKTMVQILFVVLAFSRLPPIHAEVTGDPTLLPLMNAFGLGVVFDYDRREMDTEDTVSSNRILGQLYYSVTDNLGVYAKCGLFRTETFYGEDSNWGIGIGLGVHAKVASFQDGRIQLGIDGQIFRSQVDYNDEDRVQAETLSEDITWMEYQCSGVISWRAYVPVYLYTGVQFSKITSDYDLNYYNWNSHVETKFSFDKQEKTPVALLWGVDYEIADMIHVYGELKALSEISGAIGLSMHF